MSDQVTVVCYIDREKATAFRSVANIYSNSRSNAYFAGELLDLGLEQYLRTLDPEKRDKLTSDARLALLNLETRRKEDRQTMLNAIVSRGIDEKAADELHQIAIDLDLDEEEARKFAEESPFASVIAFSNNGTKMGRCQRWLAMLFTDECRLARPAVIGMGKSKGYHESMIDRASRKLSIKKEKGRGGTWYWMTPEANNDNSNNNDCYIDSQKI